VSAWLLSGGEAHGHSPAQGGQAGGQRLDCEEPQERVAHGAHRDHNLRAAFIHVAADAAVSVLAILGLTAARFLGWMWMDPMMGIVGGGVIVLWAYALVRDTSCILLDMTPDTALAARMRRRLEQDGDRVADLHLWRLGPGHFGAIVSIVPREARDVHFYRSALRGFSCLSHLTIEVVSPKRGAGASWRGAGHISAAALAAGCAGAGSPRAPGRCGSACCGARSAPAHPGRRCARRHHRPRAPGRGSSPPRPTSRLCSTTTAVLPAATSRCSTCSSFSTSAMC